jgi:pyridoxal phosphate enzyme (YggS family)
MLLVERVGLPGDSKLRYLAMSFVSIMPAIMSVPDTFASRLADVQSRIASACARAGRDSSEVVLLPVSKTFGPERIREAAALGLRRFGESKMQEVREKAEVLADCGIDWVVIGHLQTNKAKDAARLASEVQSLDRLDLAQALDRRLQQEGRALDVLVQVRTSDEPGKHGLDPAELPVFLRALARDYASLRVRGLMTLAVNSGDAQAVRACFRSLREWRDRLRDEAIDGVDLSRLSMGMSGDFELAIQEGSTEIRVGSALFGARVYGTGGAA